MKEDSIVAIIPAAGIGSRFDGDVPKQYFNVNGSSIIESAVLPFLNSKYVSKIIIPIAKNDKYTLMHRIFLIMKKYHLLKVEKIDIIQSWMLLNLLMIDMSMS
mgnify:CR=1 FL=1